jgi:hypothetical protein
LPTAVAQVLYPRMAEQYGRTARLGDLIRMAIKPTIFSVIGMIPMVVVGWIAAGPAIRFIVPAYAAAVPAVRWSLLVPVALSFCPVINVYNVLRRQDLYIVAILLGMGVYVGSLMWLVRGGAVLTAFPQAMLVGRVVFAAASYALLVPVYLQHDKA